MNVNTGAVLGMASYPTYEPSEFIGGISQEKWDEYTYKPSDNIEAAQSNRAIRAVYAPGSTFKIAPTLCSHNNECKTVLLSGDEIG